jgi:hypothetical protein
VVEEGAVGEDEVKTEEENQDLIHQVIMTVAG